MKYKGRWLIGFLLFIVCLNVSAFPYGFSDKERDTVNLQTFIISDFGDEKDQSNNIAWKVRFSRFAKPADPAKEMSGPDTNACTFNYMEGRPLGLPQEQEAHQKWCLGVKAQFIKKGYNWIEIYPTIASNGIMSGDKPSTTVESYAVPLNMVGVVKSLDVWLWGGNYHYWLEFYLEDFKGILHRLPAGDIAYVGWKNLRTRVPDNILQAEHHVPFLKPLKLQMIKLWSYPTERVDQFYTYLDYLQVQTDVYLERFNGDDLANKTW